MIQRELVEGFSKACLAARADLVDAAAQVISDPALRIEHESDLKEGRLTPVPASQLGGALALMQEAGEHEAVIEYAPECLAAVKSRSGRRDITLSAALAHCELSHNALNATPPRVGEGCELLDIASSILVAEAGPRFSKELQDTINYTLVEMAPAYVIELIAMPLEAKKERKEGVRALRQILWADGDAALADRDAYVVEVNRHLTSSEVVELFLEAPEHIPADAEEVYQSAMAHIVTGYKERRPMLIADADEMFAQLEEAAYSAAAESRAQAEQMSRMAAAAGQPPPAGTWTTPPPAEPVNVERAVCQMLLGRVDDCAYSLGMGADPSPYPLDPQVERFVTEHSPPAITPRVSARSSIGGSRTSPSPVSATAPRSTRCRPSSSGSTNPRCRRFAIATSRARSGPNSSPGWKTPRAPSQRLSRTSQTPPRGPPCPDSARTRGASSAAEGARESPGAA